jgi:hypothetical protein
LCYIEGIGRFIEIRMGRWTEGVGEKRAGYGRALLTYYNGLARAVASRSVKPLTELKLLCDKEGARW